MNQKHCRGCPRLDFNAMTDEMYCKLKDFELIRLRWHKQRPDWCPLVKQKGQKNDQYTGNKLAEGLRAKSDDYCELNDEGKTAFRMAIAALELFGNAEQLPSEQPEQRWIPCSERYPEENQICIVTDETMRNTYEYRFCKETYDENQGWTYLRHRIIAWMPLPKPYKGEQESER